jgi:hypothetical protein
MTTSTQSQDSQAPETMDMDTPLSSYEVGSLGLSNLKLGFDDFVVKECFQIRLEQWKDLKKRLEDAGNNFVPDEKKLEYLGFIGETIQQIENDVSDKLKKTDEKRALAQAKKLDKVIRELNNSIDENNEIPQINEEPVKATMEVILFYKEKLQSSKSIKIAYDLGKLMEQLKHEQSSKKKFIELIKQTTGWSKSYVNFLISLFYFTDKYRRILKSTYSIHKFYVEFRRIKEEFSCMSDSDKLVWKN